MSIHHIERLVTNVQAEGLYNTIWSLVRATAKRLGVLHSYTLIYQKTLVDEQYTKSAFNTSSAQISICRREEDFKDIESFTPKLLLLPWREWFERDSLCITLNERGRLFGYGWIHFCFYDRVVNEMTFNLDTSEAYLGPFFIEPKFRKRGLYHTMVNFALQYLKKKGRFSSIYTASNIKNSATIKVMIANGFVVIGLIKSKNSKHRVIELTNDSLVSKKFTNTQN